MAKKVSVIVPVRNGAAYMERLVKMFHNQTYPSLELIICENGSTDGTREAATEAFQKYPSDDHCGKVFVHCDRDGVSAARNDGLKKATGEYIIFSDGDDLVAPDYVEYLVRAIRDVYMASCGYTVMNETEVYHESPESTARVLGREDMLCRLFFDENYQGFIWNKIFRKQIIDKYGLRFHEDVFYNEDRTFVVEYMVHSKNARMAPERKYHYIEHAQSAMGVLSKKHKTKAELERQCTELLGFYYMKKALRRFPDAKFFCEEQEVLSAGSIYYPLMLEASCAAETKGDHIRRVLQASKRVPGKFLYKKLFWKYVWYGMRTM